MPLDRSQRPTPEEAKEALRVKVAVARGFALMAVVIAGTWFLNLTPLFPKVTALGIARICVGLALGAVVAAHSYTYHGTLDSRV